MKINFVDKKTSTLLCLAAMFFWGSLFPMIKIGYKAFAIDVNSPGSILLFAGLRFTVCGIILVSLTSFRNKSVSVPHGSVLIPDRFRTVGH